MGAEEGLRREAGSGAGRAGESDKQAAVPRAGAGGGRGERGGIPGDQNAPQGVVGGDRWRLGAELRGPRDRET